MVPSNRSFALQAKPTTSFFSGLPARSFATTQKVPAMGDSISEGVVQEFTKQIGEYVEADECIARIETDKVTVDILAAHSGVITKWHTEVDETIEVDALLCDIDTDAKAGSAPPKAAAAAPVAEAKKEAAPVKAAEPTPAAPKAPVAQQAAPITPASGN